MDVSEVESPYEGVTVHGVITSLSPIKEGTSQDSHNYQYFSAKMSDGKKSMRVISFHPSLHSDMQTHLQIVAQLLWLTVKSKKRPYSFELDHRNCLKLKL